MRIMELLKTFTISVTNVVKDFDLDGIEDAYDPMMITMVFQILMNPYIVPILR